jgi:hypothetical protein
MADEDPELASAGVIKLTTKPETERVEAEKQRDDVHAEALMMLHRAVDLIRRWTETDGNRCTGLAITFTMEDGSYARLLPEIGPINVAALIGAIATTEHDLILRTLVPD